MVISHLPPLSLITPGVSVTIVAVSKGKESYWQVIPKKYCALESAYFCASGLLVILNSPVLSGNVEISNIVSLSGLSTNSAFEKPSPVSAYFANFIFLERWHGKFKLNYNVRHSL